jgi:cytochrome d ubiquinol oxidase subunit II
MSLPETVALVMLAALVLYTLLAGADFGAGVWDLFASGPRAPAQRKLIEQAIAPVWEANHVWLIFAIVVLFSAFPAAFSAMTTALHIPLTVMLLGIVLRGSAFVFRQYGEASDAATRAWGRTFAIASLLTPVFLGICIGAITEGRIRVRDGIPVSGFVEPWFRLFPLSVGALTLSLFAFLAAVYLTTETTDPALQRDFRGRALIALGAVASTALIAAFALDSPGHRFRETLFGSWWSIPLVTLAAASAGITTAALLREQYSKARAYAIALASALVVGWGLAQHPYLVAPDVTLANTAAPGATLALLLPVIGIGALILIPSLYWLLRLFKSERNQRDASRLGL